MGFGPAPPHPDIRRQGEDVLQVAGLEAGVLHDLQQQVRRGQSQALGGVVPLAGGDPCSAGLA